MAVAAARRAFKTTWGKNVTGIERARLINKLADLIDRDQQSLNLSTTGNLSRSPGRLLLASSRYVIHDSAIETLISSIPFSVSVTMQAGPTRL